MNYPEDTTHMKKWFFKSRKEIDNICLKKYNDFKEEFKDYNIKIPKYNDVEKTKVYFLLSVSTFL